MGANTPADASGGQATGDDTIETSPLLVGEVVGEYRIDNVLGRGGMGYVYGAVHTVIGKRAAIKVLNRELSLNPEAVERFVTEARAVNQIGHPNIVDVFGFGATTDGRQFMVMEWLRGETLSERQAAGPLEVAAICRILDAIASALEAAHAEHIAHRDLKPDNVFLASIKGGGEVVKLLDFGIAKLLGTDEIRMERTRTGFMMGTPAYMSPEQARGKDVDHRTDIYSLGVIAYELFCGTPPFFHETAMDMVVAHMHSTPQAPSASRPGLSPAIDTLVLGMMEKQAGARPSLPAIRAALAEIAGGATQLTSIAAPSGPRTDGTPVPLRGTGPTVAPRAKTVTTMGTTSGQMAVVAPARRRGPLLIGAGVLVAALAVLGYVVTRPSGAGSPESDSAAGQAQDPTAGGETRPTPSGAPVGAAGTDPGHPGTGGQVAGVGSAGAGAGTGDGSGGVDPGSGAGSAAPGPGSAAVGEPGDTRPVLTSGADPGEVRRPGKRDGKGGGRRDGKLAGTGKSGGKGDGKGDGKGQAGEVTRPTGAGPDDDGTANPFRK